MKKNFLIFCTAVAAVGLTAFGYMQSANALPGVQTISTSPSFYGHAEMEFIYDVNSRFLKTVTKTQVQNAQTMRDLFTKQELEGLLNFEDVKLTIIPEGEQKSAVGENDELNAAQKNLLQSIDYGTDFYFEANCKKRVDLSNHLADYDFVYYITLVPEKEASYIGGSEGLINYLKANSAAETYGVSSYKLKSGKVRFVVGTDGRVKTCALESTSGYQNIDDKMLELILNLPNAWEPATNAKGEKVEQELVFFFGQRGC